MLLKRLVLITAAVALAACSDSPYGSSSSCTPTATQVCTAGGNAFNPVTRTVSATTTVTWINGDGVAHTVTNDPGSTETFNLTLGSGGTVTHQFNTAGTYTYHCQIHGAPGTGMHGTITVN
jgi:plastocyanin